MVRRRIKPQPVHLAALDMDGTPACITGRGETTDDPARVTCKRCRESGSMQRLLMRRSRGAR